MVDWCSMMAGRSKPPRSGSRSMPRRSASGATGSSPRARRACWIGPVAPHRPRTGPLAVRRRGDPAAPQASVGSRPHRATNRPGRLDGPSDPAMPGWVGSTGRPGHQPRAGRRYQRDRPGELIHVDVKKIAGIPTGAAGGSTDEATTRHRRMRRRLPVHPHRLDDRTRIAYSEILDDEQAGTAVAFWLRAARWFAYHGITCERVLTDNGSCYRSRPGTRPVDTGTPSRRPAPTGPRPTARSSVSTGSCSRNGPTSAPGPPKPNAQPPTTTSSTSTITTDPTAHSAGHTIATLTPSPGTTSPRSTASPRRRRPRGATARPSAGGRRSTSPAWSSGSAAAHARDVLALRADHRAHAVALARPTATAAWSALDHPALAIVDGHDVGDRRRRRGAPPPSAASHQVIPTSCSPSP